MGIYPFLALGASSLNIIGSEIQVNKHAVWNIPFKYRIIKLFWYKIYGLLLRLKIMKKSG